ncbi:MAG: hypothetical protein IJB79_06025 [Candidatus Gastranaerophilales bacterium]|nr:hypothetical protein [Candidatus Gastranaerophilales bacterium]
MQQLSKINSAIDSNRQMFQHLSDSKRTKTPNSTTNAISYNQVQYYNDDSAIKKEKRKKLSKILTLTFTAVASLSILGGLAFQMLKKKITPQELISQVQGNRHVKSAISMGEKFVNFFTNIDALKNDIWTQISSKIKMRGFDEKIRKGYEKLSIAENQQKYAKHKMRILPFLHGLGTDKFPPSYGAWYNDLSKEIGEKVNPEGRRISQVLFEGFKKTSPEQKFVDRMKTGFVTLWKNGSSSIIADDNIADVYQKYAKGIPAEVLPEGITLSDELYSLNKTKKDAAFRELTGKIRELIDKNSEKFDSASAQFDKELYQKAVSKATTDTGFDRITYPEYINDEYHKLLAEAFAQDLAEMNRILKSGAKETIAKQRDLHLGNASVDVLGMIGSAGLLGGAVISADSKEERKSITLDLGVPLFSSMAFSFIGGIKNISGFTSAVVGLIFGKAVSMTVEGIEKVINKIKNKENKQ